MTKPEYKPLYNVTIPARPEGEPKHYSKAQQLAELEKCAHPDTGPLYFVQNYCQIYDNSSNGWIPFRLWPAQVDALITITRNRFIVALKSRQVGLSWLVLCFILWLSLFRPAIFAIIFSKDLESSLYLMNDRFKGIYARLPIWMKSREVRVDNKKQWKIENGSTVKSSSSGGSDGFAASVLMVDEADIIHEANKKSLAELLTDAEPMVGSADGWIILISRADKSRPDSTFKRIFRAAMVGKSAYVPIFIPWYARPDRDEAWYQEKLENAEAMEGSHDPVKEQYPATADEALEPPQTGKRFPRKWVLQCYFEAVPIEPEDDEALLELSAQIPEEYLTVYRKMEPGREYCVTIDGAEGGQAADDSVATVFDWWSGEEVAVIAGKIEVDTFALYVKQLAKYYSWAILIPERNNIGKTLILWWQEKGEGLSIMEGPDSNANSKKFGWHQNQANKAAMWSKTAEYLRDKNILIHSRDTMLQLADINASSLEASPGFHDDMAVSAGLYCAARELMYKKFVFDFLS